MKMVVFSIDAYSHLGPLYWRYLKDKWPQHPECVFVANLAPIDVPAEVVHIRGKEMDFGLRMRRFLEWYKDNYLLLMMIDYIPKSANPQLLEKAMKVIKKPNIGHVRLRPCPVPPTLWRQDKDFGVIDKRAPYSLSLQPGLWEADLLYDLLRNGESAWRTETHGSTRTSTTPKIFLSTVVAAIGHHNYYRKKKADPIPDNVAWRVE